MFEKFLSEHLNENTIELFSDIFLSNSEEKDFTNPFYTIQHKVIMLKYALKMADIEIKRTKVNNLIKEANEELKRTIKLEALSDPNCKDSEYMDFMKTDFLKNVNHLSFLLQWRNKLMRKKDKLSRKMINKTSELVDKEFSLKDLSKENDFQQKLPLSYKEIVETFHSIYDKSKSNSIDEIQKNITLINARLNDPNNNQAKQTTQEQIIEVEHLIQKIYNLIIYLSKENNHALSFRVKLLQECFFALMHLCKRHNKLIKNLKKIVGVQKESRLDKLKKAQQNING
ncbi:hypothetical protein HMPREF1430_00875 [Helicobacter pylori GAM96Ai]|uniref:hypothetical protein n=1 Tax=Helicobacter pylori TaxID=210 RepID=UPI0002B91B02|nr:hypothetical protein [Helicobacter pylori]EMH42832.1 hypothetical protein HMPREF1430_00875 [Helicobacter pylori GAM96Ai]